MSNYSINHKHPQKIALLIKNLNELLAYYHLHYQKMRNFHWNVYGQHFFELHREFENLYNDVKEKIDIIAERILTLGHRPVSNYSDYLYMSEINEVKGLLSPDQMAEETLSDFGLIIKKIKECLEEAQQADDEGSIDILAEYLKQAEKKQWMFGAFTRKQVSSFA